MVVISGAYQGRFPVTQNALQPFGGPAPLGFAWSLAFQVVGFIAQGISLGKNVYDAIRGAGEQIPADQKLDPQDVSTISDQLAKQYPTTSRSQWEQLINQTLADKVTPQAIPAPPCPQGYSKDPITGLCLEIREAGMGMPTWGWLVLGGLALFLLLPRLGIAR